MVVAGIVVEYNPFHNGHLYQIQKIKERLNPDYIIVALGNNFTQRGEVSILDKYDKTELAIKMGVDLVLEIPTALTVSSAENFAKAGVTLLENTKVVTHLCFGAENDDIEKITSIAKTLIKEPRNYKKVLKDELSKGVSFPVARANAINEIYKNDQVAKDIINKPNNILAIEYMKELIRLNSKMTPYIIKRNGPGFYDTDIKDNISSATNIRKMLEDKKDISNYIPEDVLKKIKKNKKILTIDDFSDILLYILRTNNKEYLENIYEVKEGIDNSLIESSKKNFTITSIIDDVKSKRFTYTGISRIIANIILGITKDSYKHSLETMPKYVRVLGFKQSSEELLSKIVKANKRSKVAIITNVNKYLKDKKSNKDIKIELEKEIEYNNIYQIKANLDINSDYTKNMLVL
ncbi:MAG: nucleotidyltransferase [archaeon]|nr:nucleotidyltransferase [archaeon]